MRYIVIIINIISAAFTNKQKTLTDDLRLYFYPEYNHRDPCKSEAAGYEDGCHHAHVIKHNMALGCYNFLGPVLLKHLKNYFNYVDTSDSYMKVAHLLDE